MPVAVAARNHIQVCGTAANASGHYPECVNPVPEIRWNCEINPVHAGRAGLQAGKSWLNAYIAEPDFHGCRHPLGSEGCCMA